MLKYLQRLSDPFVYLFFIFHSDYMSNSAVNSFLLALSSMKGNSDVEIILSVFIHEQSGCQVVTPAQLDKVSTRSDLRIAKTVDKQ